VIRSLTPIDVELVFDGVVECSHMTVERFVLPLPAGEELYLAKDFLVARFEVNRSRIEPDAAC